MNNENLFDAEKMVGDYGETPKPEPGVEDRLEKFQFGGRRKSKSRRQRSSSRRTSVRHRSRTSVRRRSRTSVRHRRQ